MDCEETSLLHTPFLFAGWVFEASIFGRSRGISSLGSLIKDSWARQSILIHFLTCASGVNLRDLGLVIGA